MKQIVINIPDETTHININIMIQGDQIDVLDDRLEIQPQQIINEVCRYMNISLDEIRSNLRHNRLSRARKIIFYYIKNNTRLSTTEIGKLLNRDHATVLSSIKQTGNWLDTNYQPFVREFHHMKQRINDLKVLNKTAKRLVEIN